MIIRRQIFGAHFVFSFSLLLSHPLHAILGPPKDLFADEVESELQTSDEEELPFARHGPVLEADLEELSNQRDFWISCAIGFILDYTNSFWEPHAISSPLTPAQNLM